MSFLPGSNGGWLVTENPQSPTSELFLFEQQQFHAEYQAYYKAKRANFFRAMTEFDGLWDCFQSLNGIWFREIQDLDESQQAAQSLPCLMFRYAHSRFLVAMELGFSCCIGDAYSVLRGGIQAVAQASKIHRQPRLAVVWTEKEQGKEQENRFKQVFEADEESLFPAAHGLAELYRCWKHVSDLGPHSDVRSLGKRLEEATAGKSVNWGLHYFEKHPHKLATYLYVLFQASFYMERVFYSCFERDLKLDPQLERIRAIFQQQKERQKKYLQANYRLEPLGL